MRRLCNGNLCESEAVIYFSPFPPSYPRGFNSIIIIVDFYTRHDKYRQPMLACDLVGQHGGFFFLGLTPRRGRNPSSISTSNLDPLAFTTRIRQQRP